MRARLFAVLTFGLLATSLVGCGNTRETRPDEYANDPRFSGPPGSLVSDDGGASIVFGVNKAKGSDAAMAGAGVSVNAYLWRGALDTLSFMPLASADPFGGVIITDWYTPAGTTGERFKATAYIQGRELRADAVRVALFHQISKGGQWIDAPVSVGTQTELEDKVLTRARELRTQSVGG